MEYINVVVNVINALILFFLS